jgi:hypothetical protein
MRVRPWPDRFLVAFSLAGEQRDLVRPIAEAVEHELGRGTVFFDEWFEDYIAGSDGDLSLQAIYSRTSDMVVACVSGDYDVKYWTQIEADVIRARHRPEPSVDAADDRSRLSVLPLRVGDGEARGFPSTVIVPDARKRTPAQTAQLIVNRLIKQNACVARAVILDKVRFACDESTGDAQAWHYLAEAVERYDAFLTPTAFDEAQVVELKNIVQTHTGTNTASKRIDLRAWAMRLKAADGSC